MEFPPKIKEIVGKQCGFKDEIGLSGANIYLFDSMVLKVQDACDSAETEHKMLQWLNGKLPVPQIIAHENTNKLSFLLMSRCKGEMSCAERWLDQPKKLCNLLAQTLHTLWDTDISDCPSDCSLKYKLLQAERNISNGLVDTENAEPDTFCANGFKDPDALLNWLQDNAPSEELVLSHGDFCLPNILFHDDALSGIIDLGRSGTADKWCDVALCYRSLRDNYDGKYDGAKKNGFCVQYLFDALELKPDWDLIRYYILLDELF